MCIPWLAVSTTVTLTPLTDRGREILDQLEAEATPAFRWSERTGARSSWINAVAAPPEGYEAALERIAPDWREHLTTTPPAG